MINTRINSSIIIFIKVYKLIILISRLKKENRQYQEILN